MKNIKSNTQKNYSVQNILNFIIIIFLILYIFCSHYKYFFSSTIFLIISSSVTFLLIFLNEKLVLNSSVKLYVVILLINLMGLFVTDNLMDGIRQCVFLIIYFIFYIYFLQSESIISKFKNVFLIFSIFIMITVFIQFIFPVQFNNFLALVVRNDIYEKMMWSYKIDGAYTGLAISVSMAAFATTFVFIDLLLKFINHKILFSRKKLNFYYLFLMFLSFLGIILTSKRGIFVSCCITLCFIIFLYRKEILNILLRDRNKIIFILIFIVFISVAFIILYHNNVFISNFISRFKGKNILTGRDLIYTKTLEKFSNGSAFSYFFGNGTGSAYLVNKTGIHNVYIQILYDHGFIGLLIYLLFFLKNFINALKDKRYFSICIQLIFLIYSFSGNPLYDYYFFIPYLLFINYKNMSYRGDSYE